MRTLAPGFAHASPFDDDAGQVTPNINPLNQESSATKQAKALHDLICMMLRGPHIRQMPGADLANYIYKTGVALHNIPISLASHHLIECRQLQEIDELDPDGTGGSWGPWVIAFCESIGQVLPEYQQRA